VHSIQSACGFHTLFEIVQIARQKGMYSVNISDHGSAAGRYMNFGILVDRDRLPDPVTPPGSQGLKIWRGIEANILDEEGNSDIPEKYVAKFDLISAGFHSCGNLPKFGSTEDNTRALINFLKKYPVDILTHPCTKGFPLHIPAVVELALAYGFKLEINNANLKRGKEDRHKLEQMITLATTQETKLLIETSDGHTYQEIGENDAIEKLLAEMSLRGTEILLNRSSAKLVDFVHERKIKRYTER